MLDLLLDKEQDHSASSQRTTCSTWAGVVAEHRLVVSVVPGKRTEDNVPALVRLSRYQKGSKPRGAGRLRRLYLGPLQDRYEDDQRYSARERSGEDGIRTRGRVLPRHRFSKPALSATQPPLQVNSPQSLTSLFHCQVCS
jgi:hypothetical protein